MEIYEKQTLFHEVQDVTIHSCYTRISTEYNNAGRVKTGHSGIKNFVIFNLLNLYCTLESKLELSRTTLDMLKLVKK